MYKVTVNNEYHFDIDAHKNEFTLNGQPLALDSVILNSAKKHIIYQNKSYTIEVEQVDLTDKTASIKVNGNRYAVQIKDQFDQLLKQLGLDNLASNKILQIKAPMPGLVLNVLVAEGQEVKKGDNLLVLEAMKMENMIKSPTDGVVKKVAIKQGEKVEKNALLIHFQ